MDCTFSPALRLAPEQLAIVERADRLAQERFAPRAERHDAEAAFPAENFVDLQTHGLLAMTVPRAYGGLAVDRLTELLVLRVIARACGSTALTFAMHSRIVKFIAALGTAAQRERYLPPVAERGQLYASVTSEPRQSFRGDTTFQMETEFRPLPSGSYQLSGEKHFCSIGDRASGGLFLSGKLAGTSSPGEGFVSAVVPLDAPGVVWRGGWNAVGMRATNSGTFSFQDVPVQPEQFIGQPGQLLSSGLFGTEFPLSYGAVYLGLADAAFAESVERVNARDDLRQSEIVRRDVADMYRRIQAAELTIGHAVSLADQAPLEARFLAATQLKRVGALAAHEVCRAARRIAGGSGLLKGTPIERICRDSESALVMPPSEDRCADVIGRLLLGGFGPVTPVRVSFSASDPGATPAGAPLEPAERG